MNTNEVVGQQQLFYTEEEVQAKISQVVENMTASHQSDLQYQVVRRGRQIQEQTYEACKGMLGEVDDESMVSIYNTIAEANGWATIEAFTKQFTVTVMYQGQEVAMFQDVEAEDEDSACEDVLENMSVDSCTVSLSISYGNKSEDAEVEISSWDLDTDEFTAEANEQ